MLGRHVDQMTGAVDPAAEQLADNRHLVHGVQRDRRAVRQLGREPAAADAGVRMRGHASGLERADCRELVRRRAGAEQVLLAAGRQPHVDGGGERGRVFVEERVFRPQDEIGEPDRAAARGRLRERSPAICIQPRAVDAERHDRRGKSDFHPVRHADRSVQRRDVGIDVQRKRVDVERRALVFECVRRRDKRSVAEVAAVERRKAQMLHRHADRRLTAPARQRALEKKWTERARRALHGAELRVQPVHERAGR